MGTASLHTRPQADEFYTKLLTDYLRKFGAVSRSEIDSLLIDKLSEALSYEQKSRKVSNLLTNLRRSGKIENAGSRKKPIWKIID